MCGGKWSQAMRGEGNGETRSRFGHPKLARLFGCRMWLERTSCADNWHSPISLFFGLFARQISVRNVCHLSTRESAFSGTRRAREVARHVSAREMRQLEAFSRRRSVRSRPRRKAAALAKRRARWRCRAAPRRAPATTPPHTSAPTCFSSSSPSSRPGSCATSTWR